MLVLTRKHRQSIMIGEDIEVTVLSHDRANVRLGIRAPANLPVHRSEIYDAIRAQDGASLAEVHKLAQARRQSRA
jgi:carbon storage regulator